MSLESEVEMTGAQQLEHLMRQLQIDNKYGVSQEGWGAWKPLVEAVAKYDKIDPHSTQYRDQARQTLHTRYRSEREAYEALVVAEWRGILEGTASVTQKPRHNLIRTQSEVLGMNILYSSKLEFEKRHGKLGFKYEAVRKLEEITVQCNESIIVSVQDKKPLEWDLYRSACKEAKNIIFGSGH